MIENSALRAAIYARKKESGAEIERTIVSEVPEVTDPPGPEKWQKGLQHPEFLKRRWKPGQSGNPAGRPKTKSLEEILRKHLGETIPGSDSTRLEAMAKVLFSEGIVNKNSKIMLAIFDRLWPKPIKIQGDIENPIAITQVTRRIVRESTDSDS